MTEFIIMEDFPKSEIEFDKQFFYDKSTCYDYLLKMEWPNDLSCTQCGHQAYWLSSKNLYICKSSIFNGIGEFK